MLAPPMELPGTQAGWSQGNTVPIWRLPPTIVPQTPWSWPSRTYCPLEQGPVQGQKGQVGHGEDTGSGAPGVKHARLHFDQDKRAIM